jgi:hypothetical protein
LYALTVGAKKRHSSRLYFISPPRKWRKYSVGAPVWSGPPSGAQNWLSSSSKMLTWM